MRTQINTRAYDHVIIIDSQVVLEAKPLHLLAWGELFEGPILLLVVRQVQTEIDRWKSDGRLGKRARSFNKLLDGFIENRIPSRVMEKPLVDVALVANKSIDWDLLDGLDRDDGDDRIVAQSLNAMVDNPRRLVLLSHDMRPRDAARTFGLNAVKLPASWLREPEPSPSEKRLTELNAKIRLLEEDQPKLTVDLEAVTPELWQYRDIQPPTHQQIEAVFRKEIGKATRQSRGSRLEMAIKPFDYSHDSRIDAWEDDLRKDIPLIDRGLTKLYAQHRVRVIVENVGSIPAEGLSIELRSGNAILHSMQYWVLITGPMPPRPRLLHEAISNLDMRNSPLFRRDQFSFYWDETGPGEYISQSCASFRQGKKYVFDVYIELLSSTVPKAQVKAILTASNMKGDVNSQLLVNVPTVSMPFDDVFDADAGKLTIRPPVDLPDEADVTDLNWFWNDGSEYEPY